MSAIQSKAKIRSGKSPAYYGRKQGGCRHYICSEMTRDECVTLQHLQAFSPGDFEAYCARGEEYRRRLSGAVMNALPLSHAWVTDCECRGEWGGVFPIHLRLTLRKNRRVTLDILSPGGESPFWHGLIWATPDSTGLYVLNVEGFEPKLFGRLLARIETMVAMGITPAEIVAVLSKKGGLA